MMKTNKARTVLYANMYTAISKATAETTDAKGNVQKNIFTGFVKDLFKGAGTLTVTKFLWAVSHKTDVLPTVLFRITSHSNKGYEIERLHSGFRDQETGKKITGIELVPYIMEAAKLYKVTPRTASDETISPEESVIPEVSTCNEETTVHRLESFTDEELLAELQRREDERKAAAELARKKALVEEFLAAYNLTMDDLLEIAQVI